MKPEKQNKHQLTFIKEDKNKYIVHLQSSMDLHFLLLKLTHLEIRGGLAMF